MNNSNEIEIDKLFRLYYEDLVRFLTPYTKNSLEASDLIQEVFLKLWNESDSIDLKDKYIKSYIFSCARNKAIDFIRKVKREKKLVESYRLTSNPSLNEDFIFPRGTIDQNSNKSNIKTQYDYALSKLPSKTLEAWKLSRYDGLTYEEISMIMKVSPRTVESHIRKAKSILMTEISIQI